MFAFCPEPIEDELLYGYAGRWFILSGMASWSGFLRAAFGTTNIDLLSPVRIYHPEIRTNSELIRSKDWVLRHLTPAPFFVPSGTEKYKHLLLQSSSSRAPSLPVMQYAGRAHGKFLQFCTSCAIEQIAQHGIATWLRFHNLPGVQVCTVHSEVLRSVPPVAREFTRVPEGLVRSRGKILADAIRYAFRVREVCAANYPYISLDAWRDTWEKALDRRYRKRRKETGIDNLILLREELRSHSVFWSIGRESGVASDNSLRECLIGPRPLKNMAIAIACAEILFESGIHDFLRFARNYDVPPLFIADHSDSLCGPLQSQKKELVARMNQITKSLRHNGSPDLRRLEVFFKDAARLLETDHLVEGDILNLLDEAFKQFEATGQFKPQGHMTKKMKALKLQVTLPE